MASPGSSNHEDRPETDTQAREGVVLVRSPLDDEGDDTRRRIDDDDDDDPH